MENNLVTVFDIKKDLLAGKALNTVRAGSTRDVGVILFDPDSWKGRSDELTMNTYSMSKE